MKDVPCLRGYRNSALANGAELEGDCSAVKGGVFGLIESKKKKSVKEGGSKMQVSLPTDSSSESITTKYQDKKGKRSAGNETYNPSGRGDGLWFSL